MRKSIWGIAIAAAAVSVASAWAMASNSVTIRAARHATVGKRVTVVFSGHDSSPPNARGTFVAAVLEPPLKHGGSRCRNDLGTTEQNHPASKELFFQRLLDTHHTGHYSVKRLMPAFSVPGQWTVCAWQFNNDGRTSTIRPASRAQVHISVVRNG
jgi:hypothetical protein